MNTLQREIQTLTKSQVQNLINKELHNITDAFKGQIVNGTVCKLLNEKVNEFLMSSCALVGAEVQHVIKVNSNGKIIFIESKLNNDFIFDQCFPQILKNSQNLNNKLTVVVDKVKRYIHYSWSKNNVDSLMTDNDYSTQIKEDYVKNVNKIKPFVEFEKEANEKEVKQKSSKRWFDKIFNQLSSKLVKKKKIDQTTSSNNRQLNLRTPIIELRCLAGLISKEEFEKELKNERKQNKKKYGRSWYRRIFKNAWF